MKKVNFSVALGFFTVCFVCAGGVFQLTRPYDVVELSSTSPAGDWKVELVHHFPGFPMQSPQTYDITFINLRTALRAPGLAGHLEMDSAGINSTIAEWSPTMCIVKEKEPGWHVFTGTIPTATSGQVWTVSLAPLP